MSVRTPAKSEPRGDDDGNDDNDDHADNDNPVSEMYHSSIQYCRKDVGSVFRGPPRVRM